MENDSYYQGSYQGASYQGASATGDNTIPQLAVRNVRVSASDQPMTAGDQGPQVVYASYVTKGMAGSGGAPGVPVFLLKTGTVLEVGNYTYENGRISYELASGGSGVISTDEVDWNTTTRINSQRGVRTMLRGGHSGAGTAGF
jgi:hypothetical protein